MDLSENSYSLYMAFLRICLHMKYLLKTCFPCLFLQVKVLSPPKPEPTVEDRAFLAALDKLLVDDVQTRREENPKVYREYMHINPMYKLYCPIVPYVYHHTYVISQVPSLDVAVPMHLKGQRARHNSLSEESENLNFVVMLKKGNKQQFKGKQSLCQDLN